MSTAAIQRALRPPEIAEILAVSPDKVRWWISQGHLRAYDVARSLGGRPRWRIMPADLEAFLSAREAVAPPPKPRRRRRRTAAVKEWY